MWEGSIREFHSIFACYDWAEVTILEYLCLAGPAWGTRTISEQVWRVPLCLSLFSTIKTVSTAWEDVLHTLKLQQCIQCTKVQQQVFKKLPESLLPPSQVYMQSTAWYKRELLQPTLSTAIFGVGHMSLPTSITSHNSYLGGDGKNNILNWNYRSVEY